VITYRAQERAAARWPRRWALPGQADALTKWNRPWGRRSAFDGLTETRDAPAVPPLALELANQVLGLPAPLGITPAGW